MTPKFQFQPLYLPPLAFNSHSHSYLNKKNKKQSFALFIHNHSHIAGAFSKSSSWPWTQHGNLSLSAAVVVVVAVVGKQRQKRVPQKKAKPLLLSSSSRVETGRAGPGQAGEMRQWQCNVGSPDCGGCGFMIFGAKIKSNSLTKRRKTRKRQGRRVSGVANQRWMIHQEVVMQLTHLAGTYHFWLLSSVS